MNPQPKIKPIRLKGAEYQRFRRKVFLRYGGACVSCNKPAPLYDSDGQFNIFSCGHVAHIKSHGAGGGDTLDNARWKCFDCHIGKEHGPRFGG